MSNPVEIALVERLRSENEDQFFTLVRMHLSFVLDLNTDEVDTIEKSKYFKWNFTKRNLKSAPHGSSQNSAISTSKASSECSLGAFAINKMYEIMDFLGDSENVCQEGIFRRTGSLSRQHELKLLIIQDGELDLSNGRFSVHDCASVLKSFLADLSEPLLQEQHYQAYCQLSVQCTKGGDGCVERVLTGVQLLVLQLTSRTRSLLRRLLSLLAEAAKAPSSRMSADTLATLFTPHLLCPRRLSPEALHADSANLAPVLSFMIKHEERVFDTPTKLAADIAAYFTVREKRRMLSPNGELNESVSDRTAANTIFTFVDRDRTAVENESNPTDTALAQLYAHIQALPDSQHKRRLVKQFNRENGYGTPRQLQRYQKLKAKTFGDSIKRHIFQRGLLNKHTPKKSQELQSSNPSIQETTPVPDEDTKLAFRREKIQFPQSSTNEVSHRNIVLKNMASQMSQAKSELSDSSDYDSDPESDASNGSVHSESGALDPTAKLSPKFSSEPNLSTVDCKDDTPKLINKRGTKLFRSKAIVMQRKPNVQPKKPIKLTPKIKLQESGTKTAQDFSPLNIYKTCVTCADEVDSCSEVDENFSIEKSDAMTPRPSRIDSFKPESKKVSQLKSTDVPSTSRKYGITSTPLNAMKTLPSTPVTVINNEEQFSTPYYAPSLRRSSMSPITKSTQKMSKAMQESIMTPRSRMPVIVLSTCDQREESLFADSTGKERPSSSDSTYDSFSPKNDSDFVSTDESNASNKELSNPRSDDIPYSKFSNSDVSEREKNLRIIHGRSVQGSISSDKGSPINLDVGLPISNPSLSEPFRKYLLSRSVLTATPVDLSFTAPADFSESYLNQIGNISERKMSESLLYCLNGNNPNASRNEDCKLRDITNVIPSKTGLKEEAIEENCSEQLLCNKSPQRKRSSRRISGGSGTGDLEIENKKAVIQNEKPNRSDAQSCQTLQKISRNETDL